MFGLAETLITISISFIFLQTFLQATRQLSFLENIGRRVMCGHFLMRVFQQFFCVVKKLTAQHEKWIKGQDTVDHFLSHKSKDEFEKNK